MRFGIIAVTGTMAIFFKTGTNSNYIGRTPYLLMLQKSDVEDKRVQRIFLTSESKDLKPRLSQARDQTDEDLLAQFSREGKVLLKRLLRDIQNI
jgi:hypothetical protein